MVLLDIVKNSQINLNIGISLPINQFSFCLQFYLEGSEEHWLIFKDSNENLGLYLNTQGKVSWVFIHDKNLVFLVPKNSVQAHEWINFCFVANETKYFVKINNEPPIYNTRPEIETQGYLDIQTLIFGTQFYWDFETNLQTFRITNFYIWAMEKSLESVQKFTQNCELQYVPKDAWLNWSQLTSIGRVSH